MDRRQFLTASAAAAVTAPAAEPAALSTDVFVYGSTLGGVAAAVEAARQGLKVILACPKRHLGGMAASGLSTTDAVRTELFGGLMAEFIAGVRSHYEKELAGQPEERKLTKEGWFYEPSVAELVFTQMVEKEAAKGTLRWLPEHFLTGVAVNARRVVSAGIESGAGAKSRVTARTFIDGTYEGDLAAGAKVPYRVGRESNAEYGEPFAGIHYMNWRTGQQILTPDTGEASPAWIDLIALLHPQ